jgi:phosphoglycerol transferase MdoB-like AlkP superfamily enzyme
MQQTETTNASRQKAGGTHKKLNIALLFLFPVILVLIVEYNQMQNLSALREFFIKRPGVFLFDCFFIGVLYGVLLFTFRRGWVAAVASGLPLFIISCVEFFKYDISGSHFIPQDLALTGKFNTVASMARLRVTWPIVIAFLFLFGFVFLLWWTKASVQSPKTHRILWGSTCLLLVYVTLSSPLSQTVFAAFDVDTRAAGNKFMAAAKFENNNMVAFWASELSQVFTSGPIMPENYGKETIEALLLKDTGPKTDSKLPNVIFLMSESFADFRQLSEESVPSGIYNALDRIQKEGFVGTTIVPTFGGYTIRSEFELLHGLPVASLGDPVFPHEEVTLENPGAFPALFRDLGYATAYLHPFSADFYDRDELYPQLGFDSLFFEEDLPVDENRFRSYADDGLLFDKALSLLEEDKPAFLFITTMQNHQPYYEEGDSVTAESEFAYYLEGLAHSDQRLNAFLDELRSFEEPTLLFFVGDHYPFLGQNGSIYDALGMDETNCQILFEQPYGVWANYDADFSVFPKNPVSLFYLPHLMLHTVVPYGGDRFSETVLSFLPETPVYTTPYQTNRPAHAGLDLLTYDRTIGEGYSISQK